MNRFPRILLALPIAALALGAGACSSSSDKASSDTTVTSAAPSTTAKPTTTTTTAASGGSTSTTAAANGCAEVTDSQVKAARPDLVITTPWTCATGADGSVWVGGTGEAGGGAADVNYIIVRPSGGTFAEATDAQMAACSNPPIPASLLQFCETD